MTRSETRRAAPEPPADQEAPVWVGEGNLRHVEITPRLPPFSVDPTELRAVVHRIADREQALDAMSLALWPGWWSIEAGELKSKRPELAAARRVWFIGLQEPEREYLVAVYDLDTAGRLLRLASTEGTNPRTP
jgi:hypothetical protein